MSIILIFLGIAIFITCIFLSADADDYNIFFTGLFLTFLLIGSGIIFETIGKETQIKTIIRVTENNDIGVLLDKGVWEIEKIERIYPWYSTDKRTLYKVIRKVDSNEKKEEINPIIKMDNCSTCEKKIIMYENMLKKLRENLDKSN